MSDALQAAIGLLDKKTAAQQIPFTVQDQEDSSILIDRLVARGSIAPTRIGNEDRISIDALKEFLMGGGLNPNVRRSMGMPSETLAPIFPINGEWLGLDRKWSYEESVLEGVFATEIEKQYPTKEQFADDFRRRAQRYTRREEEKNRAWNEPLDALIGTRDLAGVSKDNDLVFEIAVTEKLTAAIQQPIFNSAGFLRMPDQGQTGEGLFLNLGEMYLVRKLIDHTRRIRRPEDPTHSPLSLRDLYASQDAYKKYSRMGMASLEGFKFTMTNRVTILDENTAQSKFFSVEAFISAATIMRVSGTSDMRLMSLAF